MKITIEANDKASLAGLRLLARAAGDLRPAFEDIGEILVRSTAKRFEDQVGPDGQTWAPLSPAHLLFKQKKGYSPKILTMRGRLRASIVAKAAPAELQVGTNVVYAAIQHFGGTIEKPERSGSLRLRTDAKGGLLRQGSLKGGMIGPKSALASKGAVFAKKGHKRFVERTFTAGAHEITIPARPFLGLSEGDQVETLATIKHHLQVALEKLRA